jgi:hypothetical protein
MAERSTMRGGSTFGWLLAVACVGGCAIHIGRKDPEPVATPDVEPLPPTVTATSTTVAKASASNVSTPTSRPTPTTAPTPRPTQTPTARPTSVPTSVPTSTPSSAPSGSPSSTPSTGDGWALVGGTGKPVPNGECTGCKGACADDAEGPREVWDAYFNDGKLVSFNVMIVGAGEPMEKSRDDLSEAVKDGAAITFKVPKDPPNGDVKLHVVNDKAEVKLGSDLIPGTCTWEEPVPNE